MSEGPPSIVACVVTYQPGEDLADNLRALRKQAARVFVVDNGSGNAAAVEAHARALGCDFIGLPRNLGVAAALNQGLMQARALGATWLATFDQDSQLPEGALHGLLAAWAGHPERDRIGVLSLTHADRATGQHYHHAWDILEESGSWRRLRSAITSGSLVRLDAVAQVGAFDERLFIDSVDHDFCLRARRHGWLVMEDRTRVLTHSIGAATVHRWLGRSLVVRNHSADRRYYMARNQLEVARQNFLADPVWSLKACLQLVNTALGVALFETQARSKLAAMAQGALHFALRRFGRR